MQLSLVGQYFYVSWLRQNINSAYKKSGGLLLTELFNSKCEVSGVGKQTLKAKLVMMQVFNINLLLFLNLFSYC